MGGGNRGGIWEMLRINSIYFLVLALHSECQVCVYCTTTANMVILNTSLPDSLDCIMEIVLLKPKGKIS